MHELACATELFAEIEAIASRKKLRKVDRITIAVGAASGIDPDFLRHSLRDHIFPGTRYAAATLDIGVSAPSLKCSRCSAVVGETVLQTGLSMNKCPSCGEFTLEISSGSAVEIKDVI